MGDEMPGAVRFLTDFSAGSRIAGYRLEEQIGRGGTAVVFRAQDERLQRQVALKILSPALAEDEEFRHRFIRESRSAAAVDDPHIVPVFEAGDANGVLFIAMRYVPSGDAGTLVRRLGPLPIARAAAIISAVASALDAAHAAGLVHRDVKPAHMLVDSRAGRPDHVYLSDFGLTKSGQSSAIQTGTGHFMGTPTYCAPEQIRGQQVDARADEYALACAAFVLLSGEPPFLRDEGMALLYAHLSEPPPRLTSRRQDLPAAVDEVLLRALAKTPADRYSSCGEFADELRAASGLQRYDSDVAIALHQRALTDQQLRLGLDHADALASRASLVAASREASRSDEAIALQQRTLTDQRQALGPEHPDTLTTRFSIAEEMSARGEHTAAEGELRAVLAIRERMLGPEHPDTLATRFSIAREMSARGRHDAAETEFRRCWRRGSGHSAGSIRTRWRPRSASPRKCRRAAIAPARRRHSGACPRCGSGRSGRSIRTRWPPGSASPRRWRPAESMPRPSRYSGTCWRRGSGRWVPITRIRWPPVSASPRRWRRGVTTPGPRSNSGTCWRS